LQTEVPHKKGTTIPTSYPHRNAFSLAKSGPFEYIVDNNMLSNYHTLGYIASGLDKTLKGKAISQIFTQNPDEMVVSFQAGDPFLIFSCRAGANAIYLHNHFARARSNSVDVLPDAAGRTISAIQIHPADRVIMIRFSSGGQLLLQFFGTKANALVVDGGGRVVNAFRHPRDLVGTQVAERTGEMLYDPAGLQQRIRTSGTAQLSSVLRSAMPAFGTTLIRELLHRSVLSPELPSSHLNDSQRATLHRELQEMLAELSAPQCRVYSNARGVPTLFSLIPLHHAQESTERTFDDIHAAIRFFITQRRLTAETGEQFTSLQASLRRQRDRIQRTLRAMEEDTRDTARATEYEGWGQAILAHLHDIHRGDGAFLLNGEHIPLAPALSPVQNAQRYFEKVKRLRTATAEKATRIGPAREQLAAVLMLLEKLDTLSSSEELHLFRQQYASTLDLLGVSEKAKKQAKLPFRVFTVDGEFQVWVGKSSQNNDLLTLHHAKPNDLWFHARGSSGSHVLLKIASGKGEPSKKAKEQAAAIAAHFSKMKTASIVPVAMTERKYVRKPKGAPAGTVILERERVLFVAPALPADPS
jgi:predicted ribosome quality control (RQC) complex YloA/Tae2 family protein